jgi:hypothetical protein
MTDQPNKYGLYHTLEHLDEMKDKVVDLTIEQMSKYADSVCRKLIDESANFDDVIIASQQPIDFDDYNVTSLGNLAYIAFHHKKREVRVAASEIIDRYRKFVKI